MRPALLLTALLPLAFTASATTECAQDQALELRFLDVGQGDAVLVRNAGKTALIDAGPSGSIAPRLRALGVDSLDLLIASHNHADHIGGADDILSMLPVRYYLDNGYPHTTQTQQAVLAEIQRRNVTYLAATERTITLGDATLRIIPSPFTDATADQNDLSIMVLVERGRFIALLSGDSEVALINAFLERDVVPDVDVLKAAHHGARNGVTPAWLDRSRPEVVVISVDVNNQYGHPDPWALRYYEAGGRTVVRTGLAGDVVITVDEDGRYIVTTQRPVAAPVQVVPQPVPSANPTPAARPCCRICRRGKACGDSCIARNLTCRKPPGCACNG